MAFDGLLTTAIAAAKGKDADIIKKNLDINALKASKNQSEDIKKALEAMASNELTKAWFGAAEPPQIGTGTFPGMLGINNNINTNNYLDEQYKQEHRLKENIKQFSLMQTLIQERPIMSDLEKTWKSTART